MTALILAMFLLIDPLADAANWTGSPVQNYVLEYRVDDRPGQLSFSLGAGEEVVGTLSPPMDLSPAAMPDGGCDLMFTVCESSGPTPGTIELSDGTDSVEYALEFPRRYGAVYFYCPYSSLASVRIRSEKPAVFTLTGIAAVREDFPLDIAEALRRALARVQYRKRPVGTVTATAGEQRITLNDARLASTGSVIEFGGEVHRLGQGRESGWPLEDGPLLAHPRDSFSIGVDMVDEPAFLTVPIMDLSRDRDFVSPGLVIRPDIHNRLLPELQSGLSSKYSHRTDGSGWVELGPGETREWDIPVQGEFQSQEQMEMCREILGRSRRLVLWVNGRRVFAERGELNIDIMNEPAILEATYTITITETSAWRKQIEILPLMKTQTNPI